jgi:hypothetical protein
VRPEKVTRVDTGGFLVPVTSVAERVAFAALLEFWFAALTHFWRRPQRTLRSCAADELREGW